MSLQLYRIGLCKTVEVPVLTNTRTEFPFADNVITMDNVIVHGFYVRMRLGKTLQSRTNVPQIDLQTLFLNLNGWNKEQYNYKLPVFTRSVYFYRGVFDLGDNSFTCDPVFIEPKLVCLSNSSVILPRAWMLPIPGDGLGINITFFYEPYDEKKHQLNANGELIKLPKLKH